MAKAVSIIHIDGEGPMPPDTHGAHVTLLAQIGYPGSLYTDILIGGHRVQVPNDALRRASAEHDQFCDTEGG